MAPFLVCLATVLCLTPACVLSQGNSRDCNIKCVPYHQRGYQCALQNQCAPPYYDDDKAQCYANCMSLHPQCLSVCREQYNRITAMCQARCSGAMPFCESRCFTEEMQEILPNHPKPNVSIWQGVPVLGRERREAEDDSTEHVSPRDDSMLSSGSMSSEEVDDIFGIWRKKRDTKRSPGSSGSMDMDDVFENWRNERDTKRSPGSSGSMDMDDVFENWRNKRDSKRSLGSTNSEDVDDIFGIQRRFQDWSWEDGDSGGGVYGDWKDIRRAETEIQQQKRFKQQ